MRCVNTYYSDEDDIVTKQSTGYGCYGDWTVCLDDSEQKSFETSDYPYRVLSWSCELREVDLYIEPEEAFFFAERVHSSASKIAVSIMASFTILALFS